MLRYCLLPYLYSEYMKAALNDDMLFQPLSFAYPDDALAAQVEDQILLGESLMLAPVYQQNATGRYVYLPEDMLCVTTSGPEDFRCQKMTAGHHYVPVAEEELIFFVRKGHLLPLAEAAKNVEELDASRLHVIAYPADTCCYTLYDDDGYGKDYEDPSHLSAIDVTVDGGVRYEGSQERTIDICFICS